MRQPPSTPSAVLEQFVQYISEENCDDAVQLYEPDATMVEQPGRLAHGTVEIHESLKALIASSVRIQISVKDVVYAGDIAFVASSWSVSNSDATQGGSRASRGEGTDVMRRQSDGSWRFVIDNPFEAHLGNSSA